MDALRKQLDALMGANRNGDVKEVNRKYYDRDVCRLFLVGLCPHDLFQLTKMDLGNCPKVHSLQLRKEYQEAKAKGKDNYDRELEDVIERLIIECDRKIQRALKRLEDDDAKAAIAIAVSEVTQSPEVVEFSKQIKEKLKEADDLELEGKSDNKIRVMEQVEELRAKRADKQAMLLLEAFNKDRALMPQPIQNVPPMAPLPLPPDARTHEMIIEKLKKAEELGELGMIDEAQKAMEEAEALKKLGARQEPTTDSSKYTSLDVRITDQKLRVCDICGAFLSVYDRLIMPPCYQQALGPVFRRKTFAALRNDRRLADHFGGKLHLGYMQIREKLDDLKEERIKGHRHDRPEDDGRLRDRATSRDRERPSSRDRDRSSRDRASSRDRDRERDDRDRGRDSVGSRDRERVRDRDRDIRSRDRDRGHERESEHARSYDSRSRKRSRSRSRERIVEHSRDRERDRSDRHRRYDRHDRY